jgi:hypothetical protein
MKSDKITHLARAMKAAGIPPIAIDPEWFDDEIERVAWGAAVVEYLADLEADTTGRGAGDLIPVAREYLARLIAIDV